MTVTSVSAYAGSAANEVKSGGVSWANPSNATGTNPATFASSVMTGSSYYLNLTNFGFAIPSGAAVVGIVAVVYAYDDQPTRPATDATIQLLQSGARIGTNKGSGASIPTASGSMTYGTSTDTWGNTLTGADVNSSTFGLSIAYAGGTSTRPFTVDAAYVQLTVYYNSAVEVDLTITSGGAATTALAFKTTPRLSLSTAGAATTSASLRVPVSFSVVSAGSATTAVKLLGKVFLTLQSDGTSTTAAALMSPALLALASAGAATTEMTISAPVQLAIQAAGEATTSLIVSLILKAILNGHVSATATLNAPGTGTQTLTGVGSASLILTGKQSASVTLEKSS